MDRTPHPVYGWPVLHPVTAFELLEAASAAVQSAVRDVQQASDGVYAGLYRNNGSDMQQRLDRFDAAYSTLNMRLTAVDHAFACWLDASAAYGTVAQRDVVARVYAGITRRVDDLETTLRALQCGGESRLEAEGLARNRPPS